MQPVPYSRPPGVTDCDTWVELIKRALKGGITAPTCGEGRRSACVRARVMKGLLAAKRGEALLSAKGFNYRLWKTVRA